MRRNKIEKRRKKQLDLMIDQELDQMISDGFIEQLPDGFIRLTPEGLEEQKRVTKTDEYKQFLEAAQAVRRQYDRQKDLRIKQAILITTRQIVEAQQYA